MTAVRMPKKGEIWRHTKKGDEYLVLGPSYNTITDQIDIDYKPILGDPDFDKFNRQLAGCEKAWFDPNKDGTPRYTFVCTMEQREAEIAKTV